MRPSRLLSFFNLSVRAGRLFGIPIDLHISLIFFLLAALSGSGLDVWHGIEYAVAIVGCILLHEMGHALTARRFHLTGLSITLHGFGGFAVSRGLRTPVQSLLISLAGPAVTFAIGFLALGAGNLGLKWAGYDSELGMQFLILHALGRINLLMGVLNLIPSLPFDGGNSLKAILWRNMPEHKALRVVGHVGLVVSPLVAVYGMLQDQNFVVIFGLMGLISSAMTLLETGGIRFKEVASDRRERKEAAAAKERARERSRAYVEDVQSRQREREERERLRKLFESSISDD